MPETFERTLPPAALSFHTVWGINEVALNKNTYISESRGFLMDGMVGWLYVVTMKRRPKLNAP